MCHCIEIVDDLNTSAIWELKTVKVSDAIIYRRDNTKRSPWVFEVTDLLGLDDLHSLTGAVTDLESAHDTLTAFLNSLLFSTVACSSDNERIRNELIESSKCGPPKDYFQILEPKASYEQVSRVSVKF